MEAASIRARLRGLALSPARFRTLAIASAVSLDVWVAAARTVGVGRGTVWLAAATFAGTIGQAPLGFITIVSDLHPLLVLSHFVLALLVLAGGVVVALEPWRLERGSL